MTREAHEDDPPASHDYDEPSYDAESALAARLGEDRHLIQLVRFGFEMEEFAKSKVGEYLVNRAETELNDAVQKLLDMNDLASDAARDAHSTAKVAVKVLRWIDEAVTTGKEAESNIVGRDMADQPVGP